MVRQVQESLVGADPITPATQLKGALRRIALFFIKDERDIDLLTCLLKLSIVMPVSALAFVLLPEYRIYLGILHILLFLFYLGPYTLMLHNIAHRPLFHYPLRFLHFWPHAVLAFFFGMTPYTYFCHHLGMHHPENNMPSDLSSTMKYRRDSFLGFLHYYFMFAVFGLFTLSWYFIKNRRWRFLRMTLMGELSWYALVAIGLLHAPQPTLVIFVIPWFLTRFLLMAGNWTQHAFVDVTDGNNPYVNSLTFIDSPYNRRCFNDGYHIGHHINMNRHFLDMPRDFLDNLHLYRQNRSVIFRKLDYFMIWFLLMTKQYKILSRFFVNVSGEAMSRDEIIAFLKSRLEPLRA